MNLSCCTIPLVCTVQKFQDMFSTSQMVLPSMFAIRVLLLPCKYLRVHHTLIVLFSNMYLSRSKPVLFNMRWHSRHDEFLCWFIYPVQVYEDHLSILTLRTLQSSARMASVSFKGQLKENIVAALIGRVLNLHDCLTTMTRDELFCELRAKSDTGWPHFLPSLLSAYFQTVFGGDVATAL